MTAVLTGGLLVVGGFLAASLMNKNEQIAKNITDKVLERHFEEYNETINRCTNSPAMTEATGSMTNSIVTSGNCSIENVNQMNTATLSSECTIKADSETTNDENIKSSVESSLNQTGGFPLIGGANSATQITTSALKLNSSLKSSIENHCDLNTNFVPLVNEIICSGGSLKNISQSNRIDIFTNCALQSDNVLQNKTILEDTVKTSLEQAPPTAAIIMCLLILGLAISALGGLYFTLFQPVRMVLSSLGIGNILKGVLPILLCLCSVCLFVGRFVPMIPYRHSGKFDPEDERSSTWWWNNAMTLVSILVLISSLVGMFFVRKHLLESSPPNYD